MTIEHLKTDIATAKADPNLDPTTILSLLEELLRLLEQSGALNPPAPPAAS